MSATIGDFVTEGVSGDRLGALYEAHAADALRLAYLLTGDRAVAQDLVQEAFVKMAGRLAHLRRAEAFGPYLRVTVVNMARMRGRRLKVERDYLARHTAELVEPHRDRDVAATESLRLALATLPFKQRAAIVLRFFEDVPDEVTRPGARVPASDRPLAHPPRAGDPAHRARGVGAVTDELRDELDRLAAGAPTPDERRDQVVRAARRRSRVGMAVAGVIAVTGVFAGVLAVGAVLDRRETRPIGPTPTGVVRVSESASAPPPIEVRGELAYFRDGPFGGSAQLVVGNADGSEPRTVGDLSISTSRLSVAPDGSSQAVYDHGLGEGSGQLEVIDLSTGVVHTIFDVGQANGPDWSPDGSTIVFSTDSGALFTIPSDGGTATPVRDEGDERFLDGYEASWSPDGDAVVAVDDAGDVFVVEVDGTSPPRRLTSIGRAGWTDWGPDGIVVSTMVHGGWALYELDPDDEVAPRALLERPGDETAPEFSPDGTFLAFVGSDGDQQDLFVLDLKTGRVDQLTDDAAQELSPAWIPSS